MTYDTRRWLGLPRRAATAACALVTLSVLISCVRVSVRRGAEASPAGESRAATDGLRVMSFNLRYDNPGDGVNAWPNRRDRVAALVQFQQVDLLGTQEVLAGMLNDLDARLPGYGRVGVARTDGRSKGEYSAIYYRRDRLALEDSGTFWLSPTPQVIGSRGWDAALERIATWARFHDRRTGCTLVHLNTHFDHVGETARRESARLIRRELVRLSAGRPVIMTGDLNSDPSSGAYRTLVSDTTDGGLPLRDGFLITRAPHYGPTSTWNAFKEIEPGRRIDYVMVSSGVSVATHGILPDKWDDRFLSDHLPVMALVVPCAR